MIKLNEKLTIIFESPDGAGKSTLIRRLKSIPSFWNIDIVDRGFISDRVYANKFSRDTIEEIPTEVYLAYWESWHKTNRKVLIVLCDADASTLMHRCTAKKDDICKNKTQKEIIEILKKDRENFRRVTEYICFKYNFPLLVLDTTKSELDCIERLEEFIYDTGI